jgi:ribosomal protein S18 acetylase RimI-like enzyme
VEIRQVREDEWRRWREVRLRMLRDDAAFFASRYEDAVQEPDDTWRRWVAEAEQGTAKILLVAEEADTWLGVVGGFVRVDPSEIHLISMWVAAEARGQGVAQRLVRALAVWAAARGASRVLLFVQEANAPARALYAKLGFSPTGDRTRIGPGRTGFKLLLAADAATLAADPSEAAG